MYLFDNLYQYMNIFIYTYKYIYTLYFIHAFYTLDYNTILHYSVTQIAPIWKRMLMHATIAASSKDSVCGMISIIAIIEANWKEILSKIS